MSVIVPARDAARLLAGTLDALAALEPVAGGMEVVVADDGSLDATGALAHAHAAVARVVRLERPAGPGAARHAAVLASSGSVLAFTDADCAPRPAWLRAGLAALDAGAGLVQGAVVRPAAAPGAVGPYDRVVEVARLSMLWETANLFVARSAYDAAGGFGASARPRWSKELGEDVALGWRLVRAGAVPAFAPDAVVEHAVHPRGAVGFVAERARLFHFGAIVRESPELRRAFLRGGVLLPGSPLLAGPWLRQLARTAAEHGARRAAVGAAADVLGLAAAALGSARARSLVL